VSRRNTLLFVLLLLSGFLHAQSVTIHGTASSCKGFELCAFQYQDCITYTREILATDTVSRDGKFTLHLDIRGAERIYLRCNHLKAPLYAEPGKNYEVAFPEKDSSRLFNPNVEQDGDLYINTSDTTGLNWLIMDFNQRFDDFWKKNYQSFVIKRMRVPLDSFRRAINLHYLHIQNPYFHSYIDYSIASTEVSTLESQNFLARDYLYNRKIGYSNFEYMTFFNQFFDKYFYQYVIKPEGAPIYDAINQRGSAAEVMNDLKQARYLGNDTLRELVMLKGLFENYNNKEFSQQRILGILDDVSKNSRVAQHRLIARNIIARYTVLKRGSMAPAFSLPDRTGKTVSLSDYKGKYVYLWFGNSKSSLCMSELKVLEDLAKKYPLIHIISILEDDKPEEMKKMLKQNPKLNWPFLLGTDNETLKHNYTIFSVPCYYLIGPDGRLMLSPAPGPFDGIDEIFYDISKKRELKFKVGEW
jgi:peroxiredoxin